MERSDELSELLKNIQVTKLNDEISYQPGSIVSKILLKKSTGNVTLFAVDKGETISEHTTPYDAIVIVIEGNIEIKIDSRLFNLSSGEMIIMPANIPHSLKAVEKFKMILVMVRS